VWAAHGLRKGEGAATGIANKRNFVGIMVSTFAIRAYSAIIILGIIIISALPFSLALNLLNLDNGYPLRRCAAPRA